MNELSCFMCKNLISAGLDGSAHHLTRDHAITLTKGMGDTGFICGQNGCTRNFLHFYNMRKHILINHFDEDNCLELELELVCEQDRVEDRAIIVADKNHEETNNINAIEPVIIQNLDEIRENNDDFQFDLKSSVINLISKFHSDSSVTDSTVTLALKKIENTLFKLTESLKKKVHLLLEQNEINQQVIDEVDDIFKIDNPFNELKTFHKQIKALIENTDFINPIEIPLGYRVDKRLNNKTNCYEVKRVMESFQYVPVIKVLEMVLSNSEVRIAVANEKPASADFLESFVDGEHFKNHPFFFKYKHAIRLKLYYDELELVNPSGSKTGVHKLGSFYYQITNIPAQINFKLDSIHILALAHHIDVQKYGFEKILHPFLEDLEKLESDDGITLHFDDIYSLRASIESFCGDGLAVHDVYNYLSPSANMFCRLCLCTRNDLHLRPLFLAPLRTK